MPPLNSFHPIGETDSEYAFCLLLERLAELWTKSASPSVADRYRVVQEFATDMSRYGPANFIYSDGELMFAHGDQRRHDTGEVRPPGLYLVQANTIPEDQSWLATGLNVSGPEQPVAILASVPLTAEPWEPLRQGELLMIAAGRVLDP